MLGRLVSTTPRRVLAGSALVFVLLGVLAAGAIEALSLNRYEAPGSEAIAARAELAQRFGTGSPNVAVLVTARSGTVDDPTVAAAGAAVTERLAAQPGVGDVWSYWSAGAPATLAAEDRRHALVLAWVPGDADRVRGEVLPAIEADVIGPADTRAVSLQLGGGDEVFRVVAQQARADFVRAELIVLPMVGLLLWLVYRRFAPALATLAVGVFSVVTTLGILRIITLFTEVSTFASNIALVMGIGLGVDYGLFVVYRFREELAAGRTVDGAVRAAVAHAGRTVAFSGATVAASLAVLVVFPFPFLSSFAYAGIAVVVTAVFGAVVVLPALLRLLGHRALPCRGVVSRAPENSFWFRTARRVMRRPVLAGGVGLLVLAVLGAPALAIDFGSPDDRLLPSSQPVRAMYDTIRADFATEEADAVQVVAPQAAPSELDDYAAALSRIEGVQRVDSVAGAFAGGLRIGEPGPGGPARFTSPQGGTWLSVLPTGARLAGDPTGLVAEVRALPAPSPVLVGGYPAELADYRDSLIERLPLVGALIVLVTFVVLFLMTGSVVAPVKATVLNLLSLSVMFGVLVWGFQEGGLAGLLGFTPTGVIEPSIPILMFCIAYGLSMDYEVFLLARIKADVDRTGDVLGSVPRGIARSGPLVTAAAVILAASFAVYATSEVTFLQQLGIGMALAVIVDATVIRGVLVPAAMRLAGRANWWAPAPLRRLHDRIGFAEEPTALVHSEEKPSLAPSPLS